MDYTEKVISFADKYLGTYKINHSGELIAETCPFCNGGEHDDKFSFFMELESGLYCCHRASCGAHGNFETLSAHFGEKVEGRSFSFPHARAKKTYTRPDPDKLLPVTEDILKYFESRRISKETVEAFKIASDSNGNIIFPFYRDGVLTYVKFRKPYKLEKGDSHKEWCLANTESILFGMDNVSFKKPLYITEGQIDAMSLYEAGITNVVSVPAGCNNLDFVTNCWDWLEKFSQIILFGDNDEVGIEMIHTLMSRLGEDRCMIAPEYPEFIYMDKDFGRLCKDANEILFCYGPEALKSLALSCEPAPIKGVLNLANVVYVDPMTVPRIMTRIPALDQFIGGLAEGGLTVFSGKRGEGKSTLSSQIVLNAIQQGESTCIYSGELSAQNFLNWLMLQATERKYLDVKCDTRSGRNYAYVPYEIQQRIRKWIDNKCFLLDNNAIEEADQSEAVIKAFTMIARRYGTKIFVVDNMMSAVCTAEEELKAQTKFANALKKFAVRFGAHVCLIAHPRKSKVGETFTNDTVSGSANITNVADNVINIEKPNIRVTKNREFGSTGLIECSYDPANRRIFQSNIGDRTVYDWDHTNLNLPLNKVDEYREFTIQVGQPATDPF